MPEPTYCLQTRAHPGGPWMTVPGSFGSRAEIEEIAAVMIDEELIPYEIRCVPLLA